MSNARLREALNAGNNTKDKGPPVADGVLSVTPDTPEAAELRSRRSAIDCVATSSTYLEDGNDGPKPHELYGRFTWKIENFSETSKRELRSNVFEVGSYKWYILVYPQGCDVCNHLSLFLCVADYDKLLPGWSHFAQFTIAVVNKDPKKSKYSDTLHRFCKKEHDWGWKKFMELSKVLDGFTVADTLVIKAQVQVIRDRVDRPFRCLDPQYRRELVRVYLTNVEGICRRFVEERRERLAWIRQDPNAFRSFWKTLDEDRQKEKILEMEDIVLKGVVKRFFNEKEVTSTLVMDALFCGCKQLEEQSRLWLEGQIPQNETPSVVVDDQQGILFIAGDVLHVLENGATETIPPCGRDEKAADGSAMRSGQDDESVKDTIERDERRLAELGKRTMEMYVISHIFTEHLEAAYREAEALKRQEALIREEEEEEQLEEYRMQLKAKAEREKRLRRKEKKKAKKEAERVRKEAEEAEKRQQEQQRKEEAEKKRKEEAEKKRKLDEQRERARQKALEEAAARAREAERREAEKRKQRVVLGEASIPKPPTSSSASTSGSTSGASEILPASVISQPPPARKQVEERCASSKDAGSQPSSSAPSTSQSMVVTRRPSDLRANGGQVTRSQELAQSIGLQVGGPNTLVQTRSLSALPAPVANGVVDQSSEVVSLRARVKELEKKLEDRDVEIVKLKGQVGEFRAREQEQRLQAAREASQSQVHRVSQVSQASQTQPQNQQTVGVTSSSVNPARVDSTPATARVSNTVVPASQGANMTPSQSHIPTHPQARGGVVTMNGGGNHVASATEKARPSTVPHAASTPVDQRAKEHPARPTGPERPTQPTTVKQDSNQTGEANRSGAEIVQATVPTKQGLSTTPPTGQTVQKAPGASERGTSGQHGMYPRPAVSAANPNPTRQHQEAFVSSAPVGGSTQSEQSVGGQLPTGQTSLPSQVPAPSMASSHVGPSSGPGHFIGPRLSTGPFTPHPHAQGHAGYPGLQSHPHMGMHQPSIPLGHAGHPGVAASLPYNANGVSGGPSANGVALQKVPMAPNHAIHPSHMNHVNSQNAGSRMVSNDPSARMNGPLRPYLAGGGSYGVGGSGPAGPMGSQGVQGAPSVMSRGHTQHEMLGPVPKGISGSGVKNGDVGFQPLMMHQRPHLQFATAISNKRSDSSGRHSEAPCLDDFAHMGLITDLLE